MHHNRRFSILLPALILLTLSNFLFTPAIATSDSFTILIYLCGTDLETDGGAATDDLKEMMRAGLKKNGPINVIVQTGGTMDWEYPQINSKKTQRWYVGNNELFLLETLPQQDMGDTKTLEEFITYGISNYPAERYGLILWDHGCGATGGVCFDEYTDNALDIMDIYTACYESYLTLDGLFFDFIGFDACLMASYEMARYLSDFSRFMVASEELEIGSGWDYQSFLSVLANNPNSTTEGVAKVIVDTYVDAGMRADPDDFLTLSVIKLDEMSKVASELEKISADLSNLLESGSLAAISRKRQGMRGFGEYGEYKDSPTDMVDLALLVHAYAEISGTDVSAFDRAMEQAVLHNRYSKNLRNVCGLSLLSPYKTADDFLDNADRYDFGDLYPNYTDFITSMTEMMSEGSHTFYAEAPTQLSGGQLTESIAPSFFQNLLVGASYTSGSAGYAWYDEEAWDEEDEYSEINADALYGYALTLSDEDMSYLSFVEGNLMLDISDEDMEAYIDLGYLQDVYIDWEENTVYSLFDGTWPTLEGQLVNMSDQSVTEHTRRSIIDVTVNGDEVYLLVVFDNERPDGAVIGYTVGYDANGNPARGYQKLNLGDVIIPMYDILYWEDDSDEMQTLRMEGDPITVTNKPLEFGYESLAEEDAEYDYVYSFCLNDIYGDYEYSDFVYFSL